MNTSRQTNNHAAKPYIGKRLSLFWLSAVAAAAVAFAACSSSDSTGSGASGSSDSSGSGTASSESVFPLSLYQGEESIGLEEFDFAELLTRGKPVILNFWAGLCPPCRAEMPSFQKIYNENADDLILIGVDVGPFVGLGSSEAGQELLQELGVTYPAGQALSAQVVRQFTILSMPTTIFYDANGEEVSRHSGFLTEGQLRGEVEELLSAAP